MQKILRTLMLTTVLMLSFALRAQNNTLTVADGSTTNSYVPVYGLYVDDYLRCQTIYPASMLSAAGNMTGEAILGLTYYVSSPASASWGIASFVVNIMEVPDTALTAFVDMTNATQVYSGPLDATQSTMVIDLDNPYIYQGGNLIVEIYSTMTGTYKSSSFYGITATGASWQGYNSSSVSAITGSARNFIPKTTFTYGTPPTCFNVTGANVNASLTTPSSLTFSWTDALNTGATYNIYNMSDTSLIGSNITDNTFTVDNLTSNTLYHFGIQTDCGNGDVASGYALVSGRTACDAMSLPWTCSFETDEIVGTTQADALPWCSSRNSIPSTVTSPNYPYSYNYSYYAHTGSRSLYFYGTSATGSTYPDTMTFILPAVDVTAFPMNENRLTFWAESSSSSDNKVVYVGSLTDPTDLDTYTYVGSVTVTGTTHTKYVVPLTTATATDPYVFIMVLNGSGSLYIDDMTLEVAPSCPDITGLTLDSQTASSANISWDDVAASGYEVEVRQGDVVLDDITVSIIDTTAEINNLTIDNDYQIYVRALCGSDMGSWSDALPVHIGFCLPNPTSIDNDGVTNVSFGGMTNATSHPTTSPYYINNADSVGSVPAGTTASVEITFATGYTYGTIIWVDWNSSMSFDANEVVYRGTSTNNTPTTLIANFDIPATQPEGTYRMRIAAADLAFDDAVSDPTVTPDPCGSFSYGIVEDYTLNVTEAPNCLAVTDLTVSDLTVNSLTLSWTDDLNAGATYTIYNMADTSVIATGVTGLEYELTGLLGSTGYTFGVEANCSSSDASSIVTISVVTDCESESCLITIVGEDSWGDGWNGNAINVMQSGEVIATFTLELESGYSLTSTVSVCGGAPVSFVWVAGQYSNETSFEILDGGQMSVYTCTSGEALTDNTTFFTLTDACPSCIAPVVTIDTITTSSVTLSWIGTADSYNVYDMTDSTLYQTVTDNTITITDLTETTHYVFGVSSNCGNDESTIITVSFNTPCGTSIALPYTETFDATSASRDCWYLEASGNIGGNYGMGFYTVENREVLRFSSYSNATDYNQYGYSPLMEASSDATNLMVNIAYATYDSSNVLHFGYITATDTIWDPTDYTTNGSSDWQLYTAVIPATATQIALHYYGNYSWYAWIDSIEIIELTGDYCYAVTNLTVDSTTSSSVFLSWTDDNNSGITYTIYDGDTEVATNIATTNYEVTGLTPASNYTFGVVANCSATESSTMVTVNASTDCGAVTEYPYVQDFDATPNCWSVIDADGDGQNWFMYQGTIQSASYNQGVLTPDNWLISPQFEIPANGNYEVTWSATAQDQSWPAEHYGVFVSTTDHSDTANFTMLQQWTLGTGVFNPVIDLSAYAGQSIYIALRHWNCTDQFRLSIDEFIVREQAGANQVTINVGQNNPAYGTVTGTGIYNIGDSVTVTATANSGYTFSKWVDESNTTISTDNPYTFVAATDLTLNAIFLDAAGTTYTITVEVNDSTMGTAVGGGTYTAGEQVTLTATAFTGYHFVNWTQSSSFGINEVGTETDLTITVTSDKTFIANFEADTTGPVVTQYTVTLNTADATMGSVSPAGATTVNAGSSFTATATANAGYQFVAWMNGTTQVSTNSTYTFNVTENVTLTATFEAIPVTQYTVTLNTADATMGTVSPAGATTVDEGSSFTATAISTPGYRFVAWKNGNVEVGSDSIYTFNVTENITLTAYFQLKIGIREFDFSNVNVYSTNSTIIVRGAENQDLFVYDMTGRCIYQHANAEETERINVLSAGTYLVRINNDFTKKVVVVK